MKNGPYTKPSGQKSTCIAKPKADVPSNDRLMGGGSRPGSDHGGKGAKTKASK